MIFRQTDTGDETIMRLKMLDEFNEVIDFLPKAYVSIDWDGNDELIFAGAHNIVNDLPMHVTLFVKFSWRQIFEQQIVILEFSEFSRIWTHHLFTVDRLVTLNPLLPLFLSLFLLVFLIIIHLPRHDTLHLVYKSWN